MTTQSPRRTLVRLHPTRVTPPFTTDKRWAELTEVCTLLDNHANRGAGAPKENR